MPTHADNRHYGTFITDSEIGIGTVNNTDGVNIGAITSYLPKEHDLSDQLDGIDKTFDLDPAVMVGTLKSFELHLDGQLLVRGENLNEKDFSITGDRKQVVLSDGFNAPNQGQVLIATYVETQGI